MRSLLSLGSVGFFAALAGMFVAFTAGVAIFMATYEEESGGGGGDATATPAAADVTIAAQNIAFDQDAVTVPADREWTLLFQNLEPVPHDIAILTEQGGDELFNGEDTSQGDILYNVPALAAGEYYFECSIHPQQMFGTMTADPAFQGAGGAEASGTESAEGTAEATAAES